MTERSIVEAAARLRRTGEPHLVATIVRGAAYRSPGARLVLTRFRWVAGGVTGGCLEGDLARDAWRRTHDGDPVLVRLPGDEIVDPELRSAFGLADDAPVELLLERAGVAGQVAGRIDALEVAARALRRGRRGAVATVFHSDLPDAPVGARLARIDGDDLELERAGFDPHLRELVRADLTAAIASGATTCRTYDTPFGTAEVLVEAFLPPPRLFVFGTGHDAVPVAQLARTLGWGVVVCAPEPRHATRDRFAMADEVLVGAPGELAVRLAETDRAIAVVMHHDVARDRACLEMLRGTRAQLIAVLGARAMLDAVIDPRVFAPPAGTPQEIALAVTARALDALGAPREPARPSLAAGGSAVTIAAARAR